MYAGTLVLLVELVDYRTVCGVDSGSIFAAAILDNRLLLVFRNDLVCKCRYYIPPLLCLMARPVADHSVYRIEKILLNAYYSALADVYSDIIYRYIAKSP